MPSAPVRQEPMPIGYGTYLTSPSNR